ncbi:hypothetical protein A1O3_05409 [Capronia epimyces CBS 606.96]|uniref:Uncharacterized protein n=1 Tax=Capronia epimyces CBS 606.96 TaxID=1182542 RepID=W9XWW8_9EURO|nr:uncharacterized protein A1O3_05409 [Capronia epimyces CBS 606.96]EXJ84738.1 hypothetical protein A1O3_05409 [Capronia epimyces CBS 606.96]
MREGYDGDDIYIMVEDEFQTIAQTYTAHLHHAEYKRLVKQAREAAPKALPEPTSPMSKEAKNRLQKLALQKRQKETLQQVMGPTSTEAEEEEVEEEEDKVIDLWSGTRLAPLMASGGLQKTSLIGLERMSSKTKAGMGFTRIQSGGHSIKDEADEDEGDQTRNGSESKTGHAQSTSHVLSSETSGSARSLAIHRRTGESSKEHPSASSSGQDGEPVLSENGRDEFRPRRLRPTTRPNQNGFLKRKSVEQDKQSRLEEVPMFII